MFTNLLDRRLVILLFVVLACAAVAFAAGAASGGDPGPALGAACPTAVEYAVML